MKLRDILIEQVDLGKYKKEVSQALASPTKFYRGASSYKQDVKLVDPYAFPNPRQSLQGNNTLNMWLSGDPAWKQYPPRARSVIMTTSEGYAAEFGMAVYRVLPFNGAILGICGAYDIIEQEAWPYFTRVIGDQYDDVASYMSMALRETESANAYKNDIIGSYQNMVKYLHWLQRFAQQNPDVIARDMEDELVGALFRYLTQSTDYVQAMSDLLSPVKNNFNLMSTAQLPSVELGQREYGHEVWTDDHCLLVREQ